MSDEPANRELMNAWRHGDSAAADALFHRFHARLLALVRSRLSRKLARRLDPDDIVLSAYRSFFVAVRNGRAAPADDDDLWPLLTTMVRRKLARQSRTHLAERRSVDREEHVDGDVSPSLSQLSPTAEQAAILTEEVERLLATLDETAREVLVRTLQGADPRTIARDLGIHERTARRALERVRAHVMSRDPTVLHLPSTTPSVTVRAESVASRSILQGTVRYSQFLLLQLIGIGAFSKVYRALDRGSGESVAVKFLRRECWNDERSLNALIREHAALQRLSHPQIVGVRGWGTTPRGGLFLVTDFIRGLNLADWRRTWHPAEAQIVAVVRSAAEGVAAAHAWGILHCDLKPTNVMRSDDGQVVLCDFGLARRLTDPEDVPRGGTAGFLCPEQISDAFGPVTERSDVYGLGGLLYALLTGSPPMTGRDLPETLANVLSSRGPVAPLQVGATTSDGLNTVVLQALDKEPTRRHASVREFADALAAVIT